MRLEKGDARVSEPARTRTRPDVELPDDGDVLVVVECTRCDVPHGERVGRQAVKDAIGASPQRNDTTLGTQRSPTARTSPTSAGRVGLWATRSPVREVSLPAP